MSPLFFFLRPKLIIKNKKNPYVTLGTHRHWNVPPSPLSPRSREVEGQLRGDLWPMSEHLYGRRSASLSRTSITLSSSMISTCSRLKDWSFFFDFVKGWIFLLFGAYSWFQSWAFEMCASGLHPLGWIWDYRLVV